MMFCITYATVGYFFSNKMVRLVLLMGPIASALAGIALGTVAEWCVWQCAIFVPDLGEEDDEEAPEGNKDKEERKDQVPTPTKKGKKRGPSRGMLTQYQKEQLRASVGGLWTAWQ